MITDEIQSFLQQEFSDNPMLLESCENRRGRLRLDINNIHLRPGTTYFGATMMLLADTAMCPTILTTMGPVVLAITTNLNINSLRRAEPQRDLLAEPLLMKVGRRLIEGEFIVFSQDDPEPVTHATCAYPIPPQIIQTKVQN